MRHAIAIFNWTGGSSYACVTDALLTGPAAKPLPEVQAPASMPEADGRKAEGRQPGAFDAAAVVLLGEMSTGPPPPTTVGEALMRSGIA